jgi:hypothetical protein
VGFTLTLSPKWGCDRPTPHLLQCGWYLNCPKDSTPALEIPLRENIKPFFMETLVSFVGTHVEGGKQKIVSKGKGKLKEKVT